MLFNISPYGFGWSGTETVLLRGLHLLKLPSAGHKGRKCLLILRRSRADLRLDSLSKESQNASINLVCLGQPTSCPGKVSCLAWIDDCYRQAIRRKYGANWPFVATGRFEYDPVRLGFTEQFLKLVDAIGVVVETASFNVGRIEANR